jgi:hypothetical protein
VVVKVEGANEELEIRSPEGQVELRIALTEQGPVLTLRGLRLELDAADTVAVNCRQFSLRTTEGVVLDAAGDVSLRSGKEIRLRSDGETFIDGKLLKLNCLDREGYPEVEGAEAMFPLPGPLPPQSNTSPVARQSRACDGPTPEADSPP